MSGRKRLLWSVLFGLLAGFAWLGMTYLIPDFEITALSVGIAGGLGYWNGSDR